MPPEGPLDGVRASGPGENRSPAAPNPGVFWRTLHSRSTVLFKNEIRSETDVWLRLRLLSADKRVALRKRRESYAHELKASGS